MRIFSLPGFSHPDPTAKPGDPAFDKWPDLSMKFVAEEYGAQLHTAVLHLMKSFPTSIFTQSQRITKCGMRAEVIKPARKPIQN